MTPVQALRRLEAAREVLVEGQLLVARGRASRARLIETLKITEETLAEVEKTVRECTLRRDRAKAAFDRVVRSSLGVGSADDAAPPRGGDCDGR
jgi:hypothetical protein